MDFCRPYTSKPVAPHSIYQPSWYETHRMPRFWWSKWCIVGCVLGATLGGPNCPGDKYLGVLCATHFGAIRKLPSHVWPSEPKVLGISVEEIDWLIARPHVPRQMAMFVALAGLCSKIQNSRNARRFENNSFIHWMVLLYTGSDIGNFY